jgi:hypothetical protein
MSPLTTSIESTRLTRWNFGLVALTLLGVFCDCSRSNAAQFHYPVAGPPTLAGFAARRALADAFSVVICILF